MRNSEFKQDILGRGLTEKLYMTQRQRKRLVKWVLCSLCCLGLLILQDVAFSRFRPLGGTVDLPVCAIFLSCLLHDAESGGKFAIWASLFYLYSGSAPGHYVVAVIPVLGILLAVFRMSYLQKGFPAIFLCCAVCVFAYEFFSFGVGLFYGVASLRSTWAVLQTAINTTVAIPLLYPAFSAIANMGGSSWIE